jgi:hypothetical protein
MVVDIERLTSWVLHERELLSTGKGTGMGMGECLGITDLWMLSRICDSFMTITIVTNTVTVQRDRARSNTKALTSL